MKNSSSRTIDKADLAVTSDRIKKVRLELGISLELLGKAGGRSKAAASQWEKGISVPDRDTLLNLKLNRNINPDYILGKSNKMFLAHRIEEESRHYINPQTESNSISIPLISWLQAGQWPELIEDFHPNDAKEWISTTANVSTSAFALEVKGDSMLNPHGPPSIPEGTVIIVDPVLEYENGDIIVARLPGSDEPILKKMIVDGPNVYLKPLNPQYEPIKIQDAMVVIGRVKRLIYEL
ncbi:MAG TPA: S24 family peptidase [Pseudomonadales bacterium]